MSRFGLAACLGLALFVLVSPQAHAADPDTPYPGPARSIGAPTNGCVAGAVAMPLSGPGWEVLRPASHRYWGNPALIAFLEDMAAKTRDLGTLLIGDIGMIRGGPMPSGHASHQMGLDVDVLLRLGDKPITEAERADPEFDNVVKPDGSLDPAYWGPKQVALLRTFVSDPRVERIFVNPAIKRDLCLTVTGARDWLHKVRPWWGHNAHFHIRLACPPGQDECLPREPVPEGLGCGADLAWWFTPDAAAPKPSTAPKPPLPAACTEILGH